MLSLAPRTPPLRGAGDARGGRAPTAAWRSTYSYQSPPETRRAVLALDGHAFLLSPGLVAWGCDLFDGSPFCSGPFSSWNDGTGRGPVHLSRGRP